MDTDAHHADGTRDIVAGDENVLHVCFCNMDYDDRYHKVDVAIPYHTSDADYLAKVRQEFIPRWNEVASKYGIKMLFWGLPMGVSEQVVIVYELTGNQELFFVFQREWLGLGTPEAGKYIRNTRTIIVH